MQTELFAQEEDRSEIWSITEITQATCNSLQAQFPVVWVREKFQILDLKLVVIDTFLLKDTNSQLKAVLFRGDALNSGYLPHEGDDCLAYGEITVYEPRGEYQLRVRHLLQDGLGNLRLQFERLKEKLLEEGLFTEEKKETSFVCTRNCHHYFSRWCSFTRFYKYFEKERLDWKDLGSSFTGARQ